jgi:hypothetical protein
MIVMLGEEYKFGSCRLFSSRLLDSSACPNISLSPMLWNTPSIFFVGDFMIRWWLVVCLKIRLSPLEATVGRLFFETRHSYKFRKRSYSNPFQSSHQICSHNPNIVVLSYKNMLMKIVYCWDTYLHTKVQTLSSLTLVLFRRDKFAVWPYWYRWT